MKKKKLIVWIGLVAVLAAGLWFIFGRKEEAPAWKTEKVTRGDIIESVTAIGTVNAITTVQVGTQVSGTIKALHADFNSSVREGQLIAELDPVTFEEGVKQARANLASAQAELERAEATATDALRTRDRNTDLFAKNLIAKSELETAETNLKIANASVSSARARIAQTEAALNQAETNLRYTRILSPVSGVVISRAVDVGQTVAASFQTPTLFTIAKDLTRMQINTSVDEADIGRVEEGQAVEFSVDAYPDLTFTGSVWQVRNAPIKEQNVVTYDVVMRVDNREMKLKPGMTANVTVITSERRGVLRVPAAALRFKMPEGNKTAKAASSPGPPGSRGAGSGRAAGSDAGPAAGGMPSPAGSGAEKGPGIWALEGGIPRRVAVRTGITDGNFTEVASGDASEGANRPELAQGIHTELVEGTEVIVEASGAGKNNNRGRPPFHF